MDDIIIPPETGTDSVGLNRLATRTYLYDFTFIMIILDEEDHQVKFDAIVAGSTVRYPDKVVGRSSTSLPDYEASEAQHRLIIGDPQSLPKKTRRNTRILKATFYALAVYVALSAVIVLPLVLVVAFPFACCHGLSDVLAL